MLLLQRLEIVHGDEAVTQHQQSVQIGDGNHLGHRTTLHKYDGRARFSHGLWCRRDGQLSAATRHDTTYCTLRTFRCVVYIRTEPSAEPTYTTLSALVAAAQLRPEARRHSVAPRCTRTVRRQGRHFTRQPNHNRLHLKRLALGWIHGFESQGHTLGGEAEDPISCDARDGGPAAVLRRRPCWRCLRVDGTAGSAHTEVRSLLHPPEERTPTCRHRSEGRESETQKTKISAIIRLPIVRACALLAACTRRVAVLWGWKKAEEKREACGGVSLAMCCVRQLRASRSREEECNAGSLARQPRHVVCTRTLRRSLQTLRRTITPVP